MDEDKKQPLLVVDDDKATAEFIARVLRDQGYPVTVATEFENALSAIKSKNFAVVLCDIQLDHAEGTSLLPIVKQHSPNSEMIFVTGFGSIDTAVKALHEGAFEYISKSDNLLDMRETLLKAVQRAIQQRDLTRAMTEEATGNAPAAKTTIVGKSGAMVKVYRAVAKAALTRENILITGESGTGKELVAHAIHDKGPWTTQPFITVNCCALTETLLESELFGHIRGSFTGATANKKGLFEEADGGTIFLDEIGDISLALQVKLLRAIQEGEIKPVGASETKKVDVRVIAATHRNLSTQVAEGKFREDLYYRLKVILIEIPPLRDRPSDLPDLIEYFVSRYAVKSGKTITGVAPEAMELLLTYSWPGNIRELENAIGRATAMTNTSLLFPEDFPAEIGNGNELSNYNTPAVESAAPPMGATVTTDFDAPESFEQVEKRHILKTLESVNYNKSRAAEILGIDRVTLYRKAFRYGLLQKKTAKLAEAAP